MLNNVLYIGRTNKLRYNLPMQRNLSALKNMNQINQDITGIYPINREPKNISRDNSIKAIEQDCLESTGLTRNILIVSMLSIERNEIRMTSNRKRFAERF